MNTILNFLKTFIVTATLLVPLDLLWIGVIMNSTYIKYLAPFMRISSNAPSVAYTSAFIAYFITVFCLVYFVIIKTEDCTGLLNVFLEGAMVGFCLYGVYEFTNHAVIKDWPWQMIFIDIAWGSFVCAATSVLSFLILSLQRP